MASKIYDAEMQILTVSFAKGIGLKDRGKVDSFDELAGSHADAGLSPLLVYSLVAPAYRSYFRLLVDPANPVPLSQFLHDAWSPRMAWGMPLTLQVKASLLASDRGFASWVEQQGIELQLPSQTKSINAFERVSRDVLWACCWPSKPGGVHLDRLPHTLSECNMGMAAYDSYDAQSLLRLSSSMDQLTFDAWRERDKRFCVSSPVVDDWIPAAVELKDAVRPRPGYAIDPDEDEYVPPAVEGIKELLAMWPGGPSAFFKGLNVKKRDFEFWASGRAHLAASELSEVRRRAVVRWRDDYDDWELGSGYLLLATTPRQVSVLYDVLSHGGDLEFAFELLGPRGEALPMRIVLFAHCGGFTNVMLFERDGRAELLLDRGKLLNFGQPVRASSSVWETALSIVEKRGSFPEPGAVGRELMEEHFDWLTAHYSQLR